MSRQMTDGTARNDGVEQQEVAKSFRCKKGLDLIF